MISIRIEPIGIIRTPHESTTKMPIQPAGAKGIRGQIEIFPEYEEGLKDIEGFSHITLIYQFHKVSEYKLQVKPFMDDRAHGIFATKSPIRPNAIGISTVRLIQREGNKLIIEEVDMLDGSPLIDIKPFYPQYDNRENVRSGWLEGKDISEDQLISDSRFGDFKK